MDYTDPDCKGHRYYKDRTDLFGRDYRDLVHKYYRDHTDYMDRDCKGHRCYKGRRYYRDHMCYRNCTDRMDHR